MKSINNNINNTFMHTRRFLLATFVSISSVPLTMAQGDAASDQHQISVVIPNIAILDLEASSSTAITATFVQDAPLEAGDKLTAPDPNDVVWLNYSSLVPTGVTRKINVKLSAVVPGVDIKVLAAASSTGFGAKGTPSAELTLTTADQSIVGSIGSAYTVSGASKGHKLTYNFETPDADYGDLVANTHPVNVVYTMVDN
jgi:hypothetical protein